MDDIVDLIPFIKAYVLPATSSSLSTSSTDSEAATASPGTRRSPRNSAIGDKQDAVSDDLSESQALCNHLKIGQMLRGNGGHGNKKSSTFGGVILKRPRGRPKRAQSQNRKFGVKEMKRWLQKHYQRHPDSYQSVAKIMLEANREVKVKVTSKKVIQGVKAVFPELKTKECDGNVYGFNGIISKKLLPRPRKNENLNPPPLLKRQPPKKATLTKKMNSDPEHQNCSHSGIECYVIKGSKVKSEERLEQMATTGLVTSKCDNISNLTDTQAMTLLHHPHGINRNGELTRGDVEIWRDAERSKSTTEILGESSQSTVASSVQSDALPRESSNAEGEALAESSDPFVEIKQEMYDVEYEDRNASYTSKSANGADIYGQNGAQYDADNCASTMTAVQSTGEPEGSGYPMDEETEDPLASTCSSLADLSGLSEMQANSLIVDDVGQTQVTRLLHTESQLSAKRWARKSQQQGEDGMVNENMVSKDCSSMDPMHASNCCTQNSLSQMESHCHAQSIDIVGDSSSCVQCNLLRQELGHARHYIKALKAALVAKDSQLATLGKKLTTIGTQFLELSRDCKSTAPALGYENENWDNM